ncbi:unnamed protein product [Calypogeia fissa]
MSLRDRFLAMNREMDSQSGELTTSPQIGSKEGEGTQEKLIPDTRDYTEDVKSLGERVRKEVRDRLGTLGDEMFDEDDSAEVQVFDEEEIVRGTKGVGALWKMALCVTVSFASYILFSGPRVEPNWIPNIVERDPIPKIYRPRSRKR